jgi:hypothetical protein
VKEEPWIVRMQDVSNEVSLAAVLSKRSLGSGISRFKKSFLSKKLLARLVGGLGRKLVDALLVGGRSDGVMNDLALGKMKVEMQSYSRFEV